jgi:choline dehydrogenase
MAAEIFDYIVIGAGSAGCAVASRMSESGRHSVLLLEAGGLDNSPWIHIPMGFGKTFGNAALTWQYSTEPVPGLNGRAVYTPSGRVLGGTSSINGLVYGRGQQADFDGWHRDGCKGWSYEGVLPFFHKSQNQERGSNEFHAVGGPLNVADQRTRNPIGDLFLDSAVKLGYPLNPDFNGASQEGVGAFQVTARRGRRVSSAVAFLTSARRRWNLEIRTGALVERLLTRDRRVLGVSYVRGGVSQHAAARRSVILSAGAIHSPTILQRSGIGRGIWLQEAGIEVVHDLPGVGGNLHDHMQARLAMKTRRLATFNTQSRNPLAMVKAALEYAFLRRGCLTFSGAQVGGFVRSQPTMDRPDLMLMFMPFSSMDYRKGLDRFAGFSLAAMQLRPESRGTVRVKSARLDEQPSIQPNYLDAEIDRQAIVAGLRIARRIAATEPLCGEIEREERPGLDVDSDAQLLDYVRTSGASVYHPVGTCKMGSEPDAVVDARLHVHGLQGLVIADASIIPSITSGPTNATAIMIGERAVDFLLESERVSQRCAAMMSAARQANAATGA